MSAAWLVQSWRGGSFNIPLLSAQYRREWAIASRNSSHVPSSIQRRSKNIRSPLMPASTGRLGVAVGRQKRTPCLTFTPLFAGACIAVWALLLEAWRALISGLRLPHPVGACYVCKRRVSSVEKGGWYYKGLQSGD